MVISAPGYTADANPLAKELPLGKAVTRGFGQIDEPEARSIRHSHDFNAGQIAYFSANYTQALFYWQPIADKYGLDLTIRNNTVDYTFSFMTVDHDGKVRMEG